MDLKKKLLVVDDEEVIRMILSEMFEDNGYTVVLAADGGEAYEIFNKSEVDFVISDIKMPNVDGIELLGKIRNTHPQRPPVLLITGYANITRENVINRGALNLIYKPFDLEELLSSVNNYFFQSEA